MSSTPIILPAPSGKKDAATPAKPAPTEIIDAEVSEIDEKPIDVLKVLSESAPFSSLAAPIIEAIAKDADVRRYADSQTIYSAGQFDGSEFFIIAQGAVRISCVDPATGAGVIENLAAGQFFGLDLSIAEIEPDALARLAVTADDALGLVVLDVENLRQVAAQRPSLMRNLARHFAEELSARRLAFEAAQTAPDRRVYAALMRYVERQAGESVWRIPKMPKHRELAEIADVEESVAAGAVASLIQEGVARRDYPGLIIDDATRFSELSR
ncbi:MAG: Crp/Fnr family transcriptional regulator [Pseudomonadota bacterium]